MKYFVVFGILLLLSIPVSLKIYQVIFSSAENPGKKPSQIDTYKIYYDSPTPELIRKMQKLDMVIIEPHHYSEEEIQRIKEHGTIVFGYLNVMEIDNWNDSVRNEVNSNDYFYRNGEKIYYPKWDSYLADISSEHYQNLLLREIETEISAKKTDGIFLDTVGNIDNEHLQSPAVLQEQQTAITSFIKSFHERYPDLLIAQNWGFHTLKNHTAPYVDFIMWESFHFSSLTNDQWSLDQIKMLNELKEQHEFEVLTVSFEEGRKSRELADRNGYIHLHTSEDYLKW
ncbi:endo alpha-1,4 polygalactosaminidase [Rossellomorea vietnamensis]|uniref:Endo alpha-1,4 polygalactosaminidase n=1 Tax=Rossellomorea vietnamensis TaxID=218284 RepID=A0A5D4K7V3_9BACI|nr:endo alpha-1,4 polygalactosaminidase [Rossellomorea vietnamensis]TYR73414.1 endo alpha-1,4 polygalactosaminidase [Rossellomorea vietnamensis]